MTAIVPHQQVAIDPGDILSTLPVSGYDWSGLGQVANWVNGHGGMLIPWCTIGRSIAASSTEVFSFRIAPKKRAVRRVWAITMLSDTDGTTATVTINGNAFDPRTISRERDSRGGSYVFEEDLSSQSDTVSTVTVSVAAAGGAVTVETLACYEETRRSLAASTADWGVDVTTLRSGQPVADLSYESLGGAIDAYDNADARRTSFFDLSVPTGIAFSPGSTTYTDILPIYPPVHAAIVTASAVSTAAPSQSSVTCAVYAKVSSGTGLVRFSSTSAGDTATCSVTSAGFAWYTASLSVKTEDLSVADGRRGSAWETVQIEAADPSAQTLSIAGLKIYRVTKPV